GTARKPSGTPGSGKNVAPLNTFISTYVHIDRPEAPEAAEWFELAARAVQMGNEKIARWRL
ncbi:MAG: hypothetical protein VXW26_16015, partial [SAR324 cluster bacterium]|nr:hypothetical protein [SAR324 cluster bacterium]